MTPEVALICENGHVISWVLEAAGKHDTKFCDKCGAKTIDTCQQCGTPIRGKNRKDIYFLSQSRVQSVPTTPPAYCHNCGMPYIWTETAIQTALEYTDELDNLSEDERKQLKESIPDLVKESPKTQLAILRFKKVGGKMGSTAVDVFRDILVDVLSETVKKSLFP